ncbi:MAG: sigma-70 family RNA polymerase sigma factor [Planctomycetota bacterium]
MRSRRIFFAWGLTREVSVSQASIETLAERAVNGDVEAFGALIRTQLPRLRRHVEGRLGAKVRELVEAEDVVQETVLKSSAAIENLHWSGEDRFFRWLARIAEHIIWNQSQKKRPAKLAIEPAETVVATPHTLSVRAERKRRFEESISSLSEDHRDVIRLTRLEGMKIADVAARMNRSPNAVKKLLARALDELRQSYGESSGSLFLAARVLSDD